jgi:hypothetical protein
MKISAAFAILLAVQPASAWMEFLNEATKPKSVKPLTGLPPGKDVDNKNLDNIFAQNQVWKNNKLKDDPEFFNKLGSTHKPEFMWIGKCRHILHYFTSGNVPACTNPTVLFFQDALMRVCHQMLSSEKTLEMSS